jgi:hypothetical protein
MFVPLLLQGEASFASKLKQKLDKQEELLNQIKSKLDVNHE